VTLTVRNFNPATDYADVASWWGAYPGWKDAVPAPDFLSPVGFICEDEKTKYCAAWVYLTGSAWGSVEFLVSNPKASGPKRKKVALDKLIDACLFSARRGGVKALWTSSDNDALIRLFQVHGFITDHKPVSHLVARLV
jgi:hypothetical protein